jgi:hypothetical protein
METHKPIESMEPPARTPLLFIFSIIVVVIVVAGAFYLYLQKSAIQDEQTRLDADIASLQNEIGALEAQKVQAAQMSQTWLDQITKSEILWSGVITRVQALIPVDSATQIPKIRILSYNGSQDGKITLNVRSQEAQIEPWDSVAEVLSVFNGSSYFANAYVPSITRGETDQGLKVLSFVLNLNYVGEKTPVNVSTQTSADQSNAQTQPKVPRQ